MTYNLAKLRLPPVKAVKPCTKSNFICLPPEIRLQIYREVVAMNPQTERTFCRHQGLRRYISAEAISPSVLRVCKLLYREALPIFYSMTTFHVLCTFEGRPKCGLTIVRPYKLIASPEMRAFPHIKSIG